MRSYGSWEGSDMAWELIFDLYSDYRYELYGPEGYDRDYKNQLKEDGEWEEELARWTPPAPEQEIVLSAKVDALLEAIKLCDKASQVCENQVARVIKSWPHGRPYRPL